MELEEKYIKIKEEVERVNSLASNLYQEYTILAQERDSEMMQWEIDKSHMETKIRLLKEVLTKKNKDYKTAEDNNRELVAFIEKWDEKISKLDEDLQIEKIKAEKYEIKLGLIDDDFTRIDVDTLDGRINFLVNSLEQYRKMLEEESLTSEAGDTSRNDPTPLKPRKINPLREEPLEITPPKVDDGKIYDIDEETKAKIKAQKYYFYHTRVSI